MSKAVKKKNSKSRKANKAQKNQASKKSKSLESDFGGIEIVRVKNKSSNEEKLKQLLMVYAFNY